MFKKDRDLILPPGAKPKAPSSKGLRKPTEEDFIDVPVMTYQRNVKCKECEKGIMIANGLGIPITAGVIHYQHECNMCKCLYDYTTQYPSAVHRVAPTHAPLPEDTSRNNG